MTGVAIGYLDPDIWSACFGMSLRDLMLCNQAKFGRKLIELRSLCAAGGVVASRNKVAKAFMESDAEWLWFIDSDMGFAPDTIERLIASAEAADALVVGGLCFGLRKAGPIPLHGSAYDVFPTVYDWFEDDERAGFVPRTDYERDAVQPVAATGAACLLIHRTALETVRERHGDRWFDPIQHPKQADPYSEDLSFCARLAQCDIGVWVDTGVKTVHHKGGLYLDEGEFDLRMQAVKDRAEVEAMNTSAA